MNAASIVVLSFVLAAGAGVATSLALAPVVRTEPVEAASAAGELQQLRAEIARLTGEVETLRRDAAAAPLPAAGNGRRLEAGEIEAIVRRILEQEGGLAGGDAGPEGAAAETPATPEDLFAELLVPGLTYDDQEAIWARIRESGRLDEVIALMESYAEANANDPDAQVDVGYAYLQKIFEVGDGPEAGAWAMKADASFDRALDLDERHWEARFSKAISLSFWPPIFGKQKDAIQHFEILVGQQEEGVAEDHFGQSYLLLGNLYHQVGEGEKADAIWKRGLGYFPADESLLEKTGQGGGDD